MRARSASSGFVFTTSVIVTAAAAVNGARAATPPEEESVVITATRTEQPLSAIGQSVSVLDAETITRLQSDTVVDLLRTVPGLTISRNGGIGTSTSVFIRGAESEHTVALIDGVKLNDPSSPGGGFNFANLLSGNIARIEVLRGSQSVLWGSQAIGGVVNIITAEPTDALAADMRAEYGYRDTRQVVGNVSQKFGRVGMSVGAGHFRTEGVSAFNEGRGGSERDGYENTGAHAKFGVDLTDNVSLDLRGWYSNGKTGIDGFPPPTFSLGDTREESRTREMIGYSAVKVSLLEGRFHNRLAVAYTDTDRDNVDPDSTPSTTFDAEGRNTRFEYQGTFDVTQSLHTTFGAETEQSRFTTASFGGPPTRGEARISSGYLQVIAQPLTGFTAIMGARHDDHEQFGSEMTTGASLAWTPNEGSTTLRASYAEGFKAPTLYQLQSDFGNAALNPESARGGDVGITQRFWSGKVELSVTGFRRDTRDLINFISCPQPVLACVGRPSGVYDNVARARAEGVEVMALLNPFDALQLQASYSHVDSENRSAGATFGKALTRRPDDTASLLVDYLLPFGVQVGATFTHTGHSFDNASNTRRVEGYDVVDLRFAWAMTDNVELQARIENLLDEKYESVYRYGQPRRAAYAGARLSF
jgi:vitamin B12 transporter